MIKQLYGILLSCVPVCCVGAFDAEQEVFVKDLDFVQQTILENHPGPCNAMDPGFTKELESNYRLAKEKLVSSKSDDEKAQVIQEFGQSFHDAHLWIHYSSDHEDESYQDDLGRSFDIQEIDDNIYWVDIPHFHPSQEQRPIFNEIISKLYTLRQQTLIFDLRGNGGGNSSWGEEILQALFGREYTQQQLDESNRNVSVDWRVSEGNLMHFEKLIPIVKEQFGEHHPTLLCIEHTYNGIKQAYAMGDDYYTESLDTSCDRPHPPNTTSAFQGKIIAIIDKGCGSSCLSFLDGLKAMKSDVTFLGGNSGADSIYMELRKVELPSGKGVLGFPIKVYRNRARGHNIPHIADIQYNGCLKDTDQLKDYIINFARYVWRNANDRPKSRYALSH